MGKTYIRTRTNQRRNLGLFFRTRHTLKILKPDIRNGQVAGILVAESLVALAVALG